MSTQQVHSQGIYHGLPVFPPSAKGLTAIITGANGISGYYMLRVLAQNPERWSKIYCLSRRPPYAGSLPKNAEHIALDFFKEPAEIAATLKEKNVKADHVFFFSYVQPPPKPGKGLWSDADEMVRQNVLLLQNFLDALKIAEIKPQRFMLQTGAKNYGGHLGPTKVPQTESDPRIELEPNFYYPQEDAVFKYCSESGGTTHWNTAMPGPILGAVPDAAMNAAFPLAVYAAVCKKLNQPIEYPCDIVSWQTPQSMSSAMMNAYLEEWAVLTPGAADQRFNACDSSAFAWEGFWPRLAGWYGISWKGPDENAKWIVKETPYVPRGYGPKGVVRRKFTLVDWAKKPEVKQAWKELADEYDLPEKELRDVDRVFGFLDGTVARHSPLEFRYVDAIRKCV